MGGALMGRFSARLRSAGMAACVLLPARAAAQVADIRLKDGTGMPVAGAIVRLLDGELLVGQALTDELGRASLRAPRLGEFRLRIDRIGFAGVLARADLVSPVERIDLVVSSEPVFLPSVVVQGRSVCGAPELRGGETAAIWKEIGKSLLAMTLGDRARTDPLLVREFHRELSLDARVKREWIYRTDLVLRAPFRTLAPEHLADRGFVETVGDSLVFAVPDAGLLLSDQFVEGHCFEARRRADGAIGLGFHPVPGARRPDIDGTLWIEPGTGELRRLEYRYTSLPEELATPGLGGVVEFARPAKGIWHVARWWVRMPRFAAETEVARPTGRKPRLVGYVEQGGRVDRTVSSGPGDHVVRLTGLIHDSTTDRGLAGAVVTIAGRTDSAVTDSLGRFAWNTVAAGPRRITARHWKLREALGRDAEREVVLSLGDTVIVRFGVPSPAEVARARCGRKGLPAVVGAVPAGDSMVVKATWRTTSGSTREVAADLERGRLFALCRLAAGPTIPIAWRTADGRTGEVRLQLTEHEARWIDLPAGALAGPAAASGGTGLGTMVGIVSNDSTRNPVEGAEVRLAAGSRGATTNATGRFSIDGLAPGRHVAIATAIGFRPTRQWIEVRKSDTVWVEFALVPAVMQLEPLVVSAAAGRARGVGREGLDERRRQGFGTFLTSDMLRRRNHVRLGQFLGHGGKNAYPVSRRRVGPQGEPCFMSVYLDGALVFRSPGPPNIWGGRGGPALADTVDLNDFPVAELEAVELYDGPAAVPTEFGGTSAACGVILLWQRRGPDQ